MSTLETKEVESIGPQEPSPAPASFGMWRLVATFVLLAWVAVLFRRGAWKLVYLAMVFPPVFLPLAINIAFVATGKKKLGAVEFWICIVGVVLNAALWPYIYEQTGTNPSLLAH